MQKKQKIFFFVGIKINFEFVSNKLGESKLRLRKDLGHKKQFQEDLKKIKFSHRRKN